MTRPATPLECFAGELVPDGWAVDSVLLARIAEVMLQTAQDAGLCECMDDEERRDYVASSMD